MEHIKEQIIPKYAIIVIGRMGQGKSSFAKMIVSQEQKQNIKVSCSFASVTNACFMYHSNFFKIDSADQQIVIIDTPGIDSKNAIHLVVEEIDNTILEMKLGIIGIALVLDTRIRDQNQQKKSYLLDCLQILRFKYNSKINLSFLILSKFDKYYEECQDNEQIFEELRIIFKEKGFQRIWDNRICWMSQPQKDKILFKKRIAKQECKQLYEAQFKKLREFIADVKINKKFISHQQYKQSILEFEKKLIDKFKRYYRKLQLSNQIFTFDINIKVQRMGFIEGTTYVLGEYLDNFKYLLKYSLIFAPLIVLMAPVVALIGVYKSQRKYNLISQCKKLKGMILTMTSQDLMVIGEKELYFPKIDYVKIDKGFNKQKQLIIKDKSEVYSIVQLKVGENVIKLKSKLPTAKEIQAIIEKVSRQQYSLPN